MSQVCGSEWGESVNFHLQNIVAKLEQQHVGHSKVFVNKYEVRSALEILPLMLRVSQ